MASTFRRAELDREMTRRRAESPDRFIEVDDGLIDLANLAYREELGEIRESFKLGPKLRARRDAASVIGRAQLAREHAHHLKVTQMKIRLHLFLSDTEGVLNA